MKFRSFLLILLLSLLPLSGCDNGIDNEISVLERRLEKLEQRCRDINSTLDGIRKIIETLESYDFLEKVEPFSENGRSGYVLYFTHSDPVTLFNGIDAETPVLGVAKGEDGVWYWTVKYPSESEATFITDNFGVRIPTSAATPLLKIENEFWMVSYDNGDVWHSLGRATGEEGASFFESVVDKGTYIELNLLNGTTINIPTWDSYLTLAEACIKVNENLENLILLREQLEAKTYVQDLTPILSGTDTIGCTLHLSSGATYTFYNGTGTNAPVLGAACDPENPDDPTLYWTIQYVGEARQWILDVDGNKLQANAPEGLQAKLSLLRDESDGLYYWAVAYGDGPAEFLLLDGNKVAANVAVPETVVLSVVSVSDYEVCITFSGGESIVIPLARPFTVTLGAPVVDNTLTMAPKDTVTFLCTLEDGDEKSQVVPIASDGFYASAVTTDFKNWTILVLSPESFVHPAESRVNLLVSDGYGTLKTVIITIVSKNEEEGEEEEI